MSPVLTDLISVYPTRSVIEFTISGMARTGRLRVTDSSKSGFREHRGRKIILGAGVFALAYMATLTVYGYLAK